MFKNKLIIAAIVILASIVVDVAYFNFIDRQQQRQAEMAAPQVRLAHSNPVPMMRIISPVFSLDGTIPAVHACTGRGSSPPFRVTGVPKDAVSLALVMHDPDVPRGGFLHWTVWNIDPKTVDIAEDALPSGAVEGNTGMGRPGYVPPCPPSGTHRYFFELYALNKKLDLPRKASREDLENAMKGHVIEKSELVARFGR